MQSQLGKNEDVWEEEVFLCGCSSLNHVALVHLYSEGNYSQVSLSLKMNKWLGFFSRLKVAFCFLFNVGKESYEYDSLLLSQKDVHRLKNLLEKSIESEKQTS